jgi:hypothetical protein
LKNSYSCSLLCQNPILWEKRVRREEDEEGEKIGLGLKGQIEKYGFGWLPNEMFDWKSNNFVKGIAEQFPFPIRVLEKRYQGRRKERATMMGILQEMDQVIGRIQVLGKEDGERRSFMLNWLATRVMRQYHQDVWEALYKSPFEFKGKKSEWERQREKEEMDSEGEGRRRKKGRVTIKNAKVVNKTWEEPPGLTYAAVKAELEEEPLPVGMGKLYLNKKDFW